MSQRYSREPANCELNLRGCLGPADPDKFVKDGGGQIRTDGKGRGIPVMWVILGQTRVVVCNHCSRIFRKDHPEAFAGKRYLPLKVVRQFDVDDEARQQRTDDVLQKLAPKTPTPISSAA
jgi:hypothetical protein